MLEALSQDYFTLFSLPRRYDIDAATLTARYRDLHRVAHPDRHAGTDALQQRYAAQLAAHINTAFQVLKDPLRRAEYLLSLRGVEVSAAQSLNDPAFLMRQMTLREALEEIPDQRDPLVAAEALDAEVRAEVAAQTQALAASLDAEDSTAAVANVQRLQFFHRLRQQLDELLVGLEDAADRV